MFLFGGTKNTDFTDSELLVKYKETGNGELLGVLFKRYSHMVYGICMKYLKNEEDSRDASMQIFEKLFLDVKKHDIDNFGGWLNRVTSNYCLMELRSRKSTDRRKQLFENEDTTVVELNPFTHQEKEEQEITLTKLEYCIGKLKEEQKECIRLFYLQEKCYIEIARETEYELKKVKSYIQNGKRNIKICMSED